ncbi:MAG: 50S ribosomal protein L17 [Bacteroidales bacterium]|nr:50S ribosomal protein L17 [Bacteroidales bacterium]
MRHRKKFNHLGRKTAHRKAMLSNMAISLIEHKRIKTTVAKAKALRSFVEPIINRSKDDTTHSRRMVFRKLQNKHAVNELFREISQKIAEREGGYTRILKTGARLGDNAEMCIIELVDYNENYFSGQTADTKRKRTRRGKSKTVENKVVENSEASEVEDNKEGVVGEVKEDMVEKAKEETKEIQKSEEPDTEETKKEEE